MTSDAAVYTRMSEALSGLTRRELLALLGGAAGWTLMANCARDRASNSAGGARSEGSLHYASLLDVAGLIEAGDLSPVELAERMLERIRRVDGRLHSYATVMDEHARAAARRAEGEIESGSYRGPLHGIPIAVKDLLYTAGVPTSAGMGVLSDFLPTFDATAVSRLEAAGAVLLGKLNLTEGAMGGYHPDFEVPVNPWGPELWPGASSSGSGVGTAAGLCFASLGTDTGGSIRFPSMANGIVGLKPTYGRVSRHGVIPLGESLDHVGPMTRRVADAAVVLEAIAGFDPEDPTSLRAPVPAMLAELETGIEGARIGFDRGYATEGIDPGLVAAIDEALGELEGLGTRVVEVHVPEFGEELQNAWFTICAFEAHHAHEVVFPSRADEFGPYFREFLEIGASVTDAEYGAASEMRAAFNERFRSVLGEVDAVVCPAGGAPFAASEDTQRGSMSAFDSIIQFVQFRFTMPADFAGTPAIVLPCGVSESGVPYTMQLLGERLTEPRLCRIGHAYEEATEWHALHPPV